MKPTAEYWIKKLRLKPHPEGGFYRETYRSAGVIPRIGRNYSTAIYFLLKKGDKSKFHKLKSDELWFYHSGGGILIYLIFPDGQLKKIRLDGFNLQAVISAGTWFAAEVVSGSYSLVSCIVAPGFDFKDFCIGKYPILQKKFPRCSKLIERFIG